MTIEFTAENINYSEIADKLLQLRSVKNGNSAFISLLKKIISGGIILLPQGIKDAMVIKLCNQHRNTIISKLNDLLSDKEIELEVRNVILEGGAKKMKIQLEVDNINYEQIIIKFLPQIIELIPQNEKTKVFTDALDIIHDERENIVKSLLQSINDEKKEALLKLFAANYKQEISTMLNKLISDNNITAEISDINIL